MMSPSDIQNVLDRVQYKNWSILLRLDEDRPYLQLRWLTADVETKRVSQQDSRKWFLSYHMTPSEVVQTALKAVLAAEEHEARELFRYRGKTIFGPHLDVEELVKIADRTTQRDSL